MAEITVKVPRDLARDLDSLVEGRLYRSREQAVHEAIRYLLTVRGKLHTREELKEVLARYIPSSLPSEKLLEEVKTVTGKLGNRRVRTGGLRTCADRIP